MSPTNHDDDSKTTPANTTLTPSLPNESTTMHPIAFTTPGCTHLLDAAILEARQAYALERLDYHSFFNKLPVPRMQQILRGTVVVPDDDRYAPKEIRRRLFAAQERSAHPLWELLLLQAMEPELVARRLKISTADDAILDAHVRETFLAALQSIPLYFADRTARMYVLRTSALALTNARKGDAQTKARAARRDLAGRQARADRAHLTLVTPAATKARDR